MSRRLRRAGEVERINRGGDAYESLDEVASDDRHPWFLYWEAYWVMTHGPRLEQHHQVLDAGGTASLFSCQLACVTAFAFGNDTCVYELRAERLDLFSSFASHVERFDHRAESSAGRNRLQTSNSGSDDERLRWPNRACGGCEHREELV